MQFGGENCKFIYFTDFGNAYIFQGNTSSLYYIIITFAKFELRLQVYNATIS